MEWLVLIPLIGVPVAIGWRLITIAQRPARPMPLATLAGWLTLSPLITTPMWFLILSSMPRNMIWQPAHFFSLLPGAGLSLVTLRVCWPCFTGATARAAWLLLFLDCLRWFNSFWLAAPMEWHDQGWGPSPLVLALIGMFAPMIYALVADQIVRQQQRHADVRAST